MMLEENDLVVGYGSQYFRKILKSDKAVEIFYEDSKNQKEIDLIAAIIATEVSIYIMRRTSGFGLCASNIHAMWDVRRNLIKKYEKKYLLKYMDYNKDVDF